MESESGTTHRTTHRKSMQRLGLLAWEERRRLSAGVALSGFSSALSLVFPKAVGAMLDFSVSGKMEIGGNFVDSSGANLSGALLELATSSPGSMCAGLLVVAALQSGVLVLRSEVLTTAGERIAANLRRRAMENLLGQVSLNNLILHSMKELFSLLSIFHNKVDVKISRSLIFQEMAFFDKNDSAELASRLSSDAALVQRALTTSIVSVSRSGTLAVGATAMMVATSPVLACASLASFPPVFLYAALQGRKMRRQQKLVQEATAEAGAVATRALGTLRTTRQLGADVRAISLNADVVVLR